MKHEVLLQEAAQCAVDALRLWERDKLQAITYVQGTMKADAVLGALLIGHMTQAFYTSIHRNDHQKALHAASWLRTAVAMVFEDVEFRVAEPVQVTVNEPAPQLHPDWCGKCHKPLADCQIPGHHPAER